MDTASSPPVADALGSPSEPSGAPALDKIHQGDCLELLSRLDAGSVDLAFADPPFNIGFKYDEYHDDHEDEVYLEWCAKWIGELHRVLKETGAFWLAIGDEYAAELKVAAQEIGFTSRNWVVWYYTFGQNCTRKFNRSHAHLFHFVKDEEQHTFNAEDPAVRVPSARALVYGDRRANPTGRLPDDTWVIRPEAVNRRPEEAQAAGPTSLQPPASSLQSASWVLRPQDLRDQPEAFQSMDDTWYFSRVAGTFKERQGFHGCQMPEQLLGRIVRISSNAGDVVLDPFAGSGTTLAVAKKLGRRWLGFELSEDYAKYGNERVATAAEADGLNGPADPVASAPTTAAGRKLAGHPLVEKAEVGERKAEASSREPAGGPGAPAPGANTSTAPAGTSSLRELTQRALIEAFTATHDGASIDWMLCDHDRQQAFHEACAEAGLFGGPGDWNRELLRLRKAGRMPKVAARRLAPESGELDRVAAAAEIAWAEARRKFPGTALDEVFSSPGKSLLFDRAAAKHGGVAPPSAFRWAALKLRKAQHALVEEAKRFHYVVATRDFARFQAWGRARVDRFDGVAGLYLLRAPDRSAVYLGETDDLGRRLASHRASRAMDRMAAQLSVLASEELPSDDYRAPLWIDLVRRHTPRLNVPPPAPTSDR